MATYDWIVIGAGITGSALAYELSQQKFKVLLLEKDLQPNNATVLSYGGLAYWSGTSSLTKELGQAGLELHRQLSNELDADTGFREIPLLLVVNPEDEPGIVAKNFQQFAIQPEILNPQETKQIEPLINSDAIAGSLKLPHGQIHAQKTAIAYQQALLRNGGEIRYEQVTKLVRQQNRVAGVTTTQNTYHAANTVICAGGLTNTLLKNTGFESEVRFTHAQVIKTQPQQDLRLNTIVMPAKQQRFALEATAKTIDWNQINNEVASSILDPGAVQLADGSFYLGQISAIVTDPHFKPDNKIAAQKIRAAIGKVLPKLADLPGECNHCLVSFNTKRIAVVGNLKNIEGIHVFNGFTSTMVFAPPLAKEFASWATGAKHTLLEQLR